MPISFLEVPPGIRSNAKKKLVGEIFATPFPVVVIAVDN